MITTDDDDLTACRGREAGAARWTRVTECVIGQPTREVLMLTCGASNGNPFWWRIHPNLKITTDRRIDPARASSAVRLEIRFTPLIAIELFIKYTHTVRQWRF